MRVLCVTAMLFLAVVPAVAQAQENLAPLARQAGEVLQKHCVGCQNGPGSSSGYSFDVTRPATRKQEISKRQPVVVPKRPQESKVWTYVEINRLSENDPKVPEAEKAILKKWVEAGAPDFLIRAKRPFLSPEAILIAVRDDLRARREDAPSQRYFMLTHLHNNNSIGVGALALALARRFSFDD